MKKKVFGRKLSRERDSRRALFRGLIKAFVTYGFLKTTKAKGKAVQAEIEKIVGKVKVGSSSNKRLIYSFMGNDRRIVDLLFSKLSSSFQNRKSGFTRMVNLPVRRGDSAQIIRLEWVDKIEVNGKDKSDKSTTKPKKEEKLKKSNVKTGIGRKK